MGLFVKRDTVKQVGISQFAPISKDKSCPEKLYIVAILLT